MGNGEKRLLGVAQEPLACGHPDAPLEDAAEFGLRNVAARRRDNVLGLASDEERLGALQAHRVDFVEIGRASCRERVFLTV